MKWIYILLGISGFAASVGLEMSKGVKVNVYVIVGRLLVSIFAALLVGLHGMEKGWSDYMMSIAMGMSGFSGVVIVNVFESFIMRKMK